MAKKITPPNDKPAANAATAAPAPEKEASIPAAPETPVVETPKEAEAPTLSAPEKRGRGRPRKDGGATAPVSPSEAGAAAAPRKGPGRPKGKSKSVSIDASDMGKQIAGLHQLAALFTGIPEFALAPQEAEMLGQAVAAVCEEYDLSMSGKTGAALQLFAAAAMVYGPRVGLIGARVKANKAAAAQARAAAVVNAAPDTSAAHPSFTVVGGTDATPSHS